MDKAPERLALPRQVEHDAGESPLVLGDQNRIEGRFPVERNVKVQPPGLGGHRFATVAVAAVPSLVTGKMVVQLSVRRALGERLNQLVDKTIRVSGRTPSWRRRQPEAGPVWRRE